MTEEKKLDGSVEEKAEESAEVKSSEEIQDPEKEQEEIPEEESEFFKWYAVRIISGHENKVKAYLDNEIRNEKLGDRINHVLIPLEKVFEVKGGKKKVKFKNFLPGYILIEADLDDKIRDFISKTPSIINMVGSKSVKGVKLEPIPLKREEVKRIKAILNDEGEKEKLDIQLNVGDPVKVTSGPFNNFSGNILEVNLEKFKVKVMVSIFGRKTPIELELTQIEKEK
ncbi:MAG: transcription termination/antitermination factor NusG [Bacteroidetes bacterium]|nr:transcription termination/antitermination factor NusG [Bacteroidota bacterium]